MGEISKDIEVMEAVALSDPSEEGSDRENVEVEKEVTTARGGGRNILAAMKKKLFEFKRAVEGRWVAHFGGGNLERTRAYHFWPGKNVFFFHGRLICGPDPRGLMLTTVSILLSSWIFTIYVGEDLPSHSRLIIVIISMILTIIVLVNLILVSSIDPGIIPRNDQESTEDVGISNGTRRRRVTINGVEKKLKYCRICKIYRPPRSCHCALCDNCVEKFDHHCPWIGQCIALRNYRFYLTFVVSGLVFFVYIFAFSCWRIHQRILRNGIGFLGMFKNCPETVALVSFSFAAIGFLGGLAIYHVYLTAINQTAYENFRQRYVVSKNPYDTGIINNIMEVLFVALPPSRVDFRAEITPKHFSTAQGIEKLKIDTQSPRWHTKLTKILKNIRGISYRIDGQEGVAHVNGRIDPEYLLRKLEQAGGVAELMEVNSSDLAYGHNWTMYDHNYPFYDHYGRSEPSYHYPYNYHTYESRLSHYEPYYYDRSVRYPYYRYEPPAQCFPQPPSPVNVHPFYDPHYSCSIM
ncbi:hypothetical protein FH972_014398 [Carpinus fangiana]|uniref:S-acyltransferase n=1 Tax=Carpinus fangiana TaxID=176857 RepID=A0A5N6R9I3_9ROSI|nr:hypothetical protein FH972_014398 [Carpinus fangiana]